MSRFLAALHSGRVLLMDGAMGTELQRAGIGEGESYELWNVTHAEQVRAIHQAYADAGAEVLLTNTFQANPEALARTGAGQRLTAVTAAALRLARDAAGEDRFVLLDVGPLADSARNAAASNAVRCASAGLADAILVETCSEIDDVAAAVRYRTERGITNSELPILLSWTYLRREDGSLRTLHGSTPESCAAATRRYAIAALGVNCGRDIGMADAVEIIRRYHSETDLPLFARPNAGTPTREGDRWVYPLAPDAMAARLPELLEAGVSMVGGCCGTTPAHIAACKPIIDTWNARRTTELR
jgi:5-methyltetrahydrofolate--homocysteine methyltransferase